VPTAYPADSKKDFCEVCNITNNNHSETL